MPDHPGGAARRTVHDPRRGPDAREGDAGRGGGALTLEDVWLGRLPYLDALAWQRARRDAVIAGHAPEALAFVEHDPVVTTGRRAVDGLDRVRAAGIPVVATERGGLATWHGPGQLVGYPIVNVGARRIGVKAWMALIEQVVAGWLVARGVPAGTVAGRPGVWVGDRKICAVGTHIAHGVTLHGFALNLAVDLRAYDLFVPCGITDAGVTSADREGLSVTPAEAWPTLAARLRQAVDTSGPADYLSDVP